VERATQNKGKDNWGSPSLFPIFKFFFLTVNYDDADQTKDLLSSVFYHKREAKFDSKIMTTSARRGKLLRRRARARRQGFIWSHAARRGARCLTERTLRWEG